MSALSRPRVYAHRGSTLLAPENTVTAFDLALGFDADVLETDVRISADDQVIITHDATLERTTNGTGKVRQHSASALKRLDAGYHMQSIHGESFAGRGIRLLTLDELFEHYPDTAINIDIKDQELGAAALVARTLTRHRRFEQVTIGSFHAPLVRHFRELVPHVRTAAVLGEVARLYFERLLPGVRGATTQFAAVQIPLSYKLIPLATRRFIRRVTAQGTEVCYWTINDPAVMRRLLSQGASGVVTDRPDLARDVFRELGHKS